MNLKVVKNNIILLYYYMEFKITSFQKYNEAVKTLLGYLKEYDKVVDKLILDGKYYSNEIEQDDYSDEDLKA